MWTSTHDRASLTPLCMAFFFYSIYCMNKIWRLHFIRMMMIMIIIIVPLYYYFSLEKSRLKIFHVRFAMTTFWIRTKWRGTLWRRAKSDETNSKTIYSPFAHENRPPFHFLSVDSCLVLFHFISFHFSAVFLRFVCLFLLRYTKIHLSCWHGR